jgi:sugar phosphate isomerase/epimerase
MLKIATKFAPRSAAFHTAAQAGFRYAELWTDERVLADEEQVAAIAGQYPLEYVLHFPNRKELAPETLEHAAGLYRRLGSKCMVIHQPLYDRYAKKLLQIAPEMRLAVENHRLSPDRLRAWSEENAYLTLDVEHVWCFTLNDAPLDHLLSTVEELLQRAGHKLRHVHLPGYLPGQIEHRPMYCSRDMIFGVFELLERIGYEGFVVSEIEAEFQNPAELRMDLLLYEAWQQARQARHDTAATPG